MAVGPAVDLPAGHADAVPASVICVGGVLHWCRLGVQVDVGPAADLPAGFFDAVRAGTPPRASSSGDSGGNVLGGGGL